MPFRPGLIDLGKDPQVGAEEILPVEHDISIASGAVAAKLPPSPWVTDTADPKSAAGEHWNSGHV